jgi:hypothetical protein
MNQPEAKNYAESTPRPLTHYLALLTPLVQTHALQSAGGLLDALWLGRLLGVGGIATTTSFFPVLPLIVGLGAGATILAGQALGARDACERLDAGVGAFEHDRNRCCAVAGCRRAGSALRLGRRVPGLPYHFLGHAGTAQHLLPSQGD